MKHEIHVMIDVLGNSFTLWNLLYRLSSFLQFWCQQIKHPWQISLLDVSQILVSPKNKNDVKSSTTSFPNEKKMPQKKIAILLRDSASFPMKSQNIAGFSAPEIIQKHRCEVRLV